VALRPNLSEGLPFSKRIYHLYFYIGKLIKNFRSFFLSTDFIIPASIEDFGRQQTRRARILGFKRPAEVNMKMPGMSPKPQKDWRI
jgi:hypothetical protein